MNRKIIDAELDYAAAVGRYQALRDVVELCEQRVLCGPLYGELAELLKVAVKARESAWSKFNEIADA